MFLIDKMIVGGIRFVFDKLAVAADQELNDDTHLRESLLAAQLKVEQGELSEEEFAALEDEVLARIREIRERRGQGSGPIDLSSGGDRGSESFEASDILGIEASFVADDLHEDLGSPAALAPSAAVIDVAPVVEATKPKPRRAKPAKKKTAAKGPRAPRRKTRSPGRR